MDNGRTRVTDGRRALLPPATCSVLVSWVRALEVAAVQAVAGPLVVV